MTDEDEEFNRIEREATMRKPKRDDDDDIQDYVRPWVGLTDEEVQTAWNNVMDGAVFTRWKVYKAIEAKLREKNT